MTEKYIYQRAHQYRNQELSCKMIRLYYSTVSQWNFDLGKNENSRLEATEMWVRRDLTKTSLLETLKVLIFVERGSNEENSVYWADTTVSSPISLKIKCSARRRQRPEDGMWKSHRVTAEHKRGIAIRHAWMNHSLENGRLPCRVTRAEEREK